VVNFAKYFSETVIAMQVHCHPHQK
jgi:hypothetical protein